MSDDNMDINNDEIVETFAKKGAINKQLCSTKYELVPLFFDAVRDYNFEKKKLNSAKYLNEKVDAELSEQITMNNDICNESLELDKELEKLQKLQTEMETEKSNLITNFANVSNELNQQIRKIHSEYDSENLGNKIKLSSQQHEEDQEKIKQLQSVVLDSKKELLKRNETNANDHLRNIFLLKEKKHIV
ncbi:hypothetical protein RI129_001168 [Pyrocoelia pectoralis]|uniref:Uncharacterized protein n=1 Tax=Pyrocoelia pectoralis TaxID=417401 RepID=A0AAN7VTL5_9COLE